MAITDIEKAKLNEFFRACDDMIKGRFILSDTKVSNILKCVVNSEHLYSLYSKCMQNFKFAQSLEIASANNANNGGYFVMPADEKQIVAFVTCFLLEVDKKNISLQSFVTENFYSPDGYNISYSNFALTVLVEYKTAVQNLLGIDEEGNVIKCDNMSEQISIDETICKAETDENIKILFANLVMSINELHTAVNEDFRIKYSEKEGILIVLKALNRAVQLEELLIINALLVPLESNLTRNKKLKPMYEKLKMLIADIYY